jgi:putative membrane protein
MQGFIQGSRGSFMLDLVAIAMLLLLPLMAFGILMAKKQRDFTKHKKVMLSLSSILLIAVVLFEVEMRLIGWKHLAAASPYNDTLVTPVLLVHLTFAISTSLLLFMTVIRALKNFPKPPKPGQYSLQHKKIGTLSAIGLTLTSTTGWLFYYLAFVAS